MENPSSLIVLSFCDIHTTLLVSLTSLYWKEQVKIFWRHTKILVVYEHVSSSPHSKALLQWVTRYCQNLRVIDVRWNRFPSPILVDLIRVSPLLELYMTSHGEKEVFEAIYETCGQIKGFAILDSSLPWKVLAKFTCLTALELGNSTSFLSPPSGDLSDILERNPELQILHLLGMPDSFAFLDSLGSSTCLKSFSSPYEQNPITVGQVRRLRRFTHLDNINFGQSSYRDFFQVFHALRRDHSNLESLSFFPHDFPGENRVLFQLEEEREIFPRLRKLGCRIKPQTREAYTQLSRTRDRLVLYDYEQKREMPHSWCYSAFGLWSLMKKYGSPSHRQW